MTTQKDLQVQKDSGESESKHVSNVGLRLKSTDRITISGLPGQGKTEFAKFLASLAMPRVEIWDPLDQYVGFPDEHRYIPKHDNIDEFEARATYFCSISNWTWIVEESEKYIRQGMPMPDNSYNLFNRGRN